MVIERRLPPTAPHKRNLPPLDQRNYEDPFLPGRKRQLWIQAIDLLSTYGKTPPDYRPTLQEQIVLKLNQKLTPFNPLISNYKRLEFDAYIDGETKRIKMSSNSGIETLLKALNYPSFTNTLGLSFDWSDSIVAVNVLNGNGEENEVVFIKKNNEVQALEANPSDPEKLQDTKEARIEYWEQIFSDITQGSINPV